VEKANKNLGLLKKLKFKISRNHLSNFYLAFIRPTIKYASSVWDGCSAIDTAKLEKYASSVWDGCSAIDTAKLEKVQLCAARIVTGLPIFASRESLYSETGWQTLKSTRYISKLTTMFKFVMGMRQTT
jgi:hypothetical protein